MDDHIGGILQDAEASRTAFEELEKVVLQAREQSLQCLWCQRAAGLQRERQAVVEEDVFVFTQDLITRCPEHGELWRLCVR